MSRSLVVALTTFLFLTANSRHIQAQEIGFTFERLPAMKPLGYWTPREVSQMILRALEKQQIQALGFVIEEKVDEDRSSVVVLQDWLRQGHLLGNNTYSYVDLSELPADDFIEHVADGQRYLKRLTQSTPGRPNFRFLRFPLLHEGDTAGKKKQVAKRLSRGGYRIVPVSIKTSDYAFNRLLLKLEHDPDQVAALKQLYLSHIEDSVKYSEEQAKRVLGGPIPHILQLHAGIATATFLPDLIDLLQKRGYRFIPVLEALQDPAYTLTEDYVGPLGLTFIDRVAATRGLPFDEEAGQIGVQEIERRLNQVP